MSRRLPSLNALRAFEAAARHLSFTRAAEELGVTQGAVSRQVKALETYLGTSLFRRLTRALELTEAGHEYLESMRDAFDRMERATERALRRQHGGILTVSVLPTFAMRWLIPRLSSFTEANPSIEVRMVASIRPVDFSREDIDVAIRVGSLDGDGGSGTAPRIALNMTTDWAGVRADPIVPDVLVAVCSPAVRDGPPPLRAPRDLRARTLLHTSTRPDAWPGWLRAVGIDWHEAPTEPAFGHFFMTLQAAAQGRGVAVVPEVLVAADLAAGHLVAPFDVAVESSGSYHLLCRHHQWGSPKVRAFRDWLMAEATTVTPAPIKDQRRAVRA